MTLGLCFWIIMLIWFLFGAWQAWQTPSPTFIGGNLIIFVLFLLLGWRVFGAPIHG